MVLVAKDIDLSLVTNGSAASFGVLEEQLLQAGVHLRLSGRNQGAKAEKAEKGRERGN